MRRGRVERRTRKGRLGTGVPTVRAEAAGGESGACVGGAGGHVRDCFTMDADKRVLPAEVSYAVTYESGQDYNRDLGGRGTLTILADPVQYRFRGRARRMLSLGPETEWTFTPEEMRNVGIGGKRVEFATKKGASGAKNCPFVFFCETTDEALAIARRMPETRDEEFVAGIEFNRRLARLPAPRSAWGWATNVIIAVNVIAFVAMGLRGAGWFEAADMKPYILFGANNGAATTGGEWWRLVTSMFLHYGVLHLALNMWALFQVGHLVERLLGRGLYLLVYLGSGVLGGLATICWHGDKLWSAGASGAVFGVYGALLGYFVRQRHGVPRGVFGPIMKSTLMFAGYNLLFGAVHPHIDNMAHIGGLVGGFVLGWIVALPIEPAARVGQVPKRFVAGAAVLALAVAVGVTIAPRFNYSPKEELAWTEVNTPLGAEEGKIVQVEREAFAAFAKNGDVAALSQWIEQEGAPFYQKWSERLGALRLRPGLETAVRRDWLEKILTLKLQGYRELTAGLVTNPSAAFAAYEENAEQIAQLVAHPPKSEAGSATR